MFINKVQRTSTFILAICLAIIVAVFHVVRHVILRLDVFALATFGLLAVLQGISVFVQVYFQDFDVAFEAKSVD